MGQKSITSAVRELLGRDHSVQECLPFINYSRLALLLRQDVEKKTSRKVSQEAVKTAIRRFAATEKKSGSYAGIKSVLEGGRLNLRNNVSVLAVYPSMHAIGKIPELERRIDRRKGEILHVIAGINCIVLILDDSNFPMSQKILRRDIINERTGLSALTITTSLKITVTPGVIAYITAILARSGINIEEISSCYNDTIIIVRKEDAIQAYRLLEDAVQG